VTLCSIYYSVTRDGDDIHETEETQPLNNHVLNATRSYVCVCVAPINFRTRKSFGRNVTRGRGVLLFDTIFVSNRVADTLNVLIVRDPSSFLLCSFHYGIIFIVVYPRATEKSTNDVSIR